MGEKSDTTSAFLILFNTRKTIFHSAHEKFDFLCPTYQVPHLIWHFSDFVISGNSFNIHLFYSKPLCSFPWNICVVQTKYVPDLRAQAVPAEYSKMLHQLQKFFWYNIPTSALHITRKQRYCSCVMAALSEHTGQVSEHTSLGSETPNKEK